MLYLVATPGSILRSASGGSFSGCPSEGVPRVLNVSAGYMSGLRKTVARVLPLRIGRLYAEGTVTASYAWSDNSPSPSPPTPGTPRPAGYEMRWWAPDNDDIVADVLVFATASKAREFVKRASSVRCRNASKQAPASWPPRASNLRWDNPDGVAQADVLFARGSRAFRVSDVPAGEPRIKARTNLRRAFLVVDDLACLLPEADCSGPGALA